MLARFSDVVQGLMHKGRGMGGGRRRRISTKAEILANVIEEVVHASITKISFVEALLKVFISNVSCIFVYYESINASYLLRVRKI